MLERLNILIAARPRTAEAWLARMARPGAGVAARTSVAARAFRVNQIDRGENLRGRKAPAWCFVNIPMNDASSSAIRARGEWKR